LPVISLSTYSLFLQKNYQQAIQFAIEHGFQGIEIWSNVFDFWPRTVTVREIETIKALARENQLSLAVHFCGGNDLAAINIGHLEESRKQLRETIELCHQIGGKVVVVHPGMAPHMSVHDKNPLTQYPRFQLPNLKKDALVRFKESLSDAAHYAERSNVVIGLENFAHVRNCIQSTFEDLAEWIDETGSLSLGITLDTGHANLEGGVEEAIGVFGSRIVHVHLNDNDGKSSVHGELGSGTIDWKAITPFLKSFDGILALEILGFDDLEGAVLRSKAFLEDLLKES
jgi:sugar phosphate isomerase/epimerase